MEKHIALNRFFWHYLDLLQQIKSYITRKIFTQTMQALSNVQRYLHLRFFDLVTSAIFRGKYKLWSSEYAIFPHLPVAFSFLGPNVLLRFLISNASA